MIDKFNGGEGGTVTERLLCNTDDGNSVKGKADDRTFNVSIVTGDVVFSVIERRGNSIKSFGLHRLYSSSESMISVSTSSSSRRISSVRSL